MPSYDRIVPGRSQNSPYFAPFSPGLSLVTPARHKIKHSTQGLWPTALSEQDRPKPYLRAILVSPRDICRPHDPGTSCQATIGVVPPGQSTWFGELRILLVLKVDDQSCREIFRSGGNIVALRSINFLLQPLQCQSRCSICGTHHIFPDGRLASQPRRLPRRQSK